MRRCRFLLPFLIALVLAACAAVRAPDDTQQLQLYFASTENHGPAIVGQPYEDEDSPTAEQLIAALLSGPTGDGLRSPFPAGLSLRGLSLDEGHLTVDFSEQYGGLTDVSLTLADYCVVLTLCQLDGIDSVEITVSGQSTPYRGHQVLTAQEVMLEIQSSGG